MKFFVNFVLLFCLSVGLVSAQVPPTCVDYNLDEAVLDCQAFTSGVGQQVWTSPSQGLTLERWTYEFNSPRPPSNSSARAPIAAMPYDCAVAYLKMICPTFYPRCVDIGSPTGPVPVFPCRSVCDAQNAVCGGFWAAIGLPPFDCDGTSSITGLPQYLDDNNTIYPCYTYPDNEPDESIISWKCPSPLRYSGRQGDFPCWIPCPLISEIVIEDDDFDVGFTVLSVLGWISFVGNLYVLITYLSFKELRQFPRRLVIFIAVAIQFALIGVVGNSVQDIEDFYCEDEFDVSHSGWCRASAWFFFFGALSASLYWTVQTFVLFWNVFLLKDPQKMAKMEWLLHVFSIGIPLIFSFIMLGLDKLGARQAQPYCFTYEASDGLEWGLFFWIVFSTSVFVTIMLVMVMVRIFKDTGMEETKWDRGRYQLQLGLFAFMFFFTVFFVCVLRFWVLDNQDDLEDGVVNWYTCIVRGFGEDVCEDQLKYVDQGLYWANLVFIGMMGIWPLVVFGLLNRQVWGLCGERASTISAAASMRTSSSSRG